MLVLYCLAFGFFHILLFHNSCLSLRMFLLHITMLSLLVEYLPTFSFLALALAQASLCICSCLAITLSLPFLFLAFYLPFPCSTLPCPCAFPFHLFAIALLLFCPCLTLALPLSSPCYTFLLSKALASFYHALPPVLIYLSSGFALPLFLLSIVFALTYPRLLALPQAFPCHCYVYPFYSLFSS